VVVAAEEEDAECELVSGSSDEDDLVQLARDFSVDPDPSDPPVRDDETRQQGTSSRWLDKFLCRGA
jgi:hypothetical protein